MLTWKLWTLTLVAILLVTLGAGVLSVALLMNVVSLAGYGCVALASGMIALTLIERNM